MWNKARGLWFKPHDTVHLMDNKKTGGVGDALSFTEIFSINFPPLLE